jgi:hypothetical protein
MMDLQQSQPHFSAFHRFSDMLKETTTGRRKHSHSSTRTPSLSTSLSMDPETASVRSRDSDLSKDARRSSMGNYADRVRQMFTPSPHHQKRGINDLPVEVLQHVFVYLEFWELVRCQSVCRVWRSLIPGDSPLLAELLYLKPSRGLQIYNLVPTAFEFEFDTSPVSIESGPQPTGARFSVGVRKEFSMTRRCMGLIRTSQEIVFHPVIMDFNHFIQKEGFKGNQEGAWREMLVSMPPLREVTLRHGKTRAVFRILSVGEEEGDGVKLAQLFDAMDEWARK